jgi:hypothetical protein
LNISRRLFTSSSLALAAFFTPQRALSDGMTKKSRLKKTSLSSLVLESRWAASYDVASDQVLAHYHVRVKSDRWDQSLESAFERFPRIVWRIDEELTKRLEREHIKEIDDANDRALANPKSSAMFSVILTGSEVNEHVAVPK